MQAMKSVFLNTRAHTHTHIHTRTQPVGFIGLGNMGAPMANNLLQKGHKLVVYDIAESAVSQAVSAGATKASSPAEVRKQLNHKSCIDKILT